MARIIGISTNKGGVLKTSLCTSLAGLLAKDGKKVLIIDTDNQGNVAITFGKNPDLYEETIYDVLTGEVAAEKVIYNVYENIDILPSNDDMAFFEFDVISQPQTFKEPLFLLKKALESVKDSYDYILIDTPPNLGLILGNVLNTVSEVLIPFQPEAYSMRSIQKILKQINSFKEQHNPELKVLGVVSTLVDLRTVLHSQVLQECRRYCYENNVKMFDTVIPRSVRTANSVAYDQLPVTLVEKKGNSLIDAYHELYKEVF